MYNTTVKLRNMGTQKYATRIQKLRNERYTAIINQFRSMEGTISGRIKDIALERGIAETTVRGILTRAKIIGINANI